MAETQQEKEWERAQEIIGFNVRENLVSAARRQLQFLAAVDAVKCLYDGPALHRAILRYEQCWLPLLAKHTENDTVDFPLVAPLDCEWIWHCHRLNPIQYAKDCERIYGRILDATYVDNNVLDVAKDRSELFWKNSYSEEPYMLNLSASVSENVAQATSENVKIYYDLATAVKRQSTFYYQVSRPYMSNERFLMVAEERYKGFLYLIKKNKERGVSRFCVPTYDIDLMWHTHQLQPLSYKQDTLNLLGKVLEHDDTDSDRSKGKKLDTGFSETTNQYENTFGRRYWRAGAMYRGRVPSPVPYPPKNSKNVSCDDTSPFIHSTSQQDQYMSKAMIVEGLLEIVSVRNVSKEYKSGLIVKYYKHSHIDDELNEIDAKLTKVSSESPCKQTSSLVCEASGIITFELICQHPCIPEKETNARSLGRVSISIEELLLEKSLYIDTWLALSQMKESDEKSGPISLRLVMSITPPIEAPYLLLSTSSSRSKLGLRKYLQRGNKSEKKTKYFDHADQEIFVVKERNTNQVMKSHKKENKKKSSIKPKTVTIYPGHSVSKILQGGGKLLVTAEEVSNGKKVEWVFINGSCKLAISNLDNFEKLPEFELSGNFGHPLRLISGRKLQYEVKCHTPEIERQFATLVRYDSQSPFGHATALLNWKSGIAEVNKEESILLVVLLASVISTTLMSKNIEFQNVSKNAMLDTKVCPIGTQKDDHKQKQNGEEELNQGHCYETKEHNQIKNKIENVLPRISSKNECVVHESTLSSGSCGGCGGGCGGCGGRLESGNSISGGCGGALGSNLDSAGKQGSCGGGCGGDCGSLIVSSHAVSGGRGGCGGACGEFDARHKSEAAGGCGAGCGGGCGGGCGSLMNQASCGGGCGSGCGGCGTRIESETSGGCGGGCGGDCGGCGGSFGGYSACLESETSGGCSGGCGGGCRKLVKPACCGGGCGSQL